MYASVDQDAMVETVEPEQLPDMTQEMLALDDVYFDFDRFSIRNEARNTLELNARQLGDREDWDLTIEGHCDERGTGGASRGSREALPRRPRPSGT